MGFPRELLASHEAIVFELRPHWIALVPSALWTVLAVVVGSAGYFFADSRVAEPTLVDNLAVAAVLILWLLLAIPPFLTWWFTLFVLTTDRLITRAGIFAKRSKELPLEKVNDVAFEQTIFERILGAGSLLIESAGERGQTRITDIRKPEQVQLRIYEESERNQSRMFTGGGGPSRGPRDGSAIPEQIEALARLHAQGVISEEEFEAKKEELLKRY